MKTYEITVDEDVWSSLKKHAEPLEDTPNTVLRRILLKDKGSTADTNKSLTKKEEFPTFTAGVPKALAQILEVIYLVKKEGLTRTDATNKVADKRGTAFQTVIDKYCRQLNKRAFEIDNLLQDGKLDEFRLLLERKFINHKDDIRAFFNSLSD